MTLHLGAAAATKCTEAPRWPRRRHQCSPRKVLVFPNPRADAVKLRGFLVQAQIHDLSSPTTPIGKWHHHSPLQGATSSMDRCSGQRNVGPPFSDCRESRPWHTPHDDPRAVMSDICAWISSRLWMSSGPTLTDVGIKRAVIPSCNSESKGTRKLRRGSWPKGRM